jgi:hypothetical protein
MRTASANSLIEPGVLLLKRLETTGLPNAETVEVRFEFGISGLGYSDGMIGSLLLLRGRDVL